MVVETLEAVARRDRYSNPRRTRHNQVNVEQGAPAPGHRLILFNNFQKLYTHTIGLEYLERGRIVGAENSRCSQDITKI